MAASPAQLRYLADAVSTASPAQRVVMLYDRMLLDIRRGGQAQQDGDAFQAAEQLRHAQQIVAELRASLRLESWTGAENLASLYGFVLAELIQLAVQPDPARLATVSQIVSGLRDSWRDAAATLVTSANAAHAGDTAVTAATAVTGATGAAVTNPIGAGFAARQAAWVG